MAINKRRKGAETPALDVEQDGRFPSGKWLGFFKQSHTLPGRHDMELVLTFRKGAIDGEGRDYVGSFTVTGRYEVQTGKCRWVKTYLKRHSVDYDGYNEGKGIFGRWSIPPTYHGGFLIWPEGMADPTQNHRSEAVDLPRAIDANDGAGAAEEIERELVVTV